MIPRVLWAQRKDIVYITIEVFEVKEEKIDIQDNVVNFSGVRGSDGAKFAVSLELFGSVDVSNSKISVADRNVSMILAKSEPGPFWPRLLKTTQKMHFIHTDFSKWIDEDEEAEEGAPDLSGMGNFDMSQFGGAAPNFDMSQFGAEEEEEFTEDNDAESSEDNDAESSEDNDAEAVKISGLTKNNESFE